jgi:glutathione reductase (NADPH)
MNPSDSSVFDCDLFVIGAGSAGVRAARFAARTGARVMVAEERDLGGTCVNVGCIPKKLFAYAAHFRDAFHDAAGFGWAASLPGFDWSTLLANKDREISRLNGVYERLLTGAGVELVRGHAVIGGPHTVCVGERRIRARYILVAVGGQPQKPGIPGAELGITSDQAFYLARLPQRIVVVGGGYIAVEFASIFQGLGVETVLLYRGERLLRHFDADLGKALAEQMQRKGVRVVLQREIHSVRRAGALELTLDDGSLMACDALMFAIGRTPLTTGLGLVEAGVSLNARGAVEVNARYQTAVPSIYAIGDCIGGVELTPVALAEAMAVVEHLFGAGERRVPYDLVPTAVFSNPNVATVGLSEEAARARGFDVAVFRSGFTPLKHQLSGSGERMLLKLVVDRATDRVLGVHMLGAEAGEVIQGFAVALTCGATKRQFDETIGIHPTAAEEFVTMRDPVALA